MAYNHVTKITIVTFFCEVASVLGWFDDSKISVYCHQGQCVNRYSSQGYCYVAFLLTTMPPKSHWDVANEGMPKGHAEMAPIQKSEIASDATDMLGIVRIRLLNTMTKRVKEFPRNNNKSVSAKTANSRMTVALFLDCNSFNMTSSCFSVTSFGLFQ